MLRPARLDGDDVVPHPNFSELHWPVPSFGQCSVTYAIPESFSETVNASHTHSHKLGVSSGQAPHFGDRRIDCLDSAYLNSSQHVAALAESFLLQTAHHHGMQKRIPHDDDAAALLECTVYGQVGKMPSQYTSESGLGHTPWGYPQGEDLVLVPICALPDQESEGPTVNTVLNPQDIRPIILTKCVTDHPLELPATLALPPIAQSVRN